MNLVRACLLGCGSLLPFHPATAQESLSAQESAGAEAQANSRDDFHEELVVRAAGLERLDVLAGTSVISGLDLQRNLDGQLGEVLEKLPGVSATSFSPGASRPILRGFGGERVRVLVDGIGAIDASNTSADHAVTVDPLTTDRIEVLRGPAVMLYGSQAIGGAVNVIDKRIPLRVPDEALHADLLMGFDTASDRAEGGLSLDAPIGQSVAVHVDGSWRRTDDLTIPSFVAADNLRADLLGQAAEEIAEGHVDVGQELSDAANLQGTLPNSWTKTFSLGSGIAVFSGDSSLGLSASYYDTNYGIPGLPGIGHVHEEDAASDADEHGEEEVEAGAVPVSIDLQQFRSDLRGTLDLGDGFFDALQTRWGYSDYTHTEFEGDEPGTVFDVSGVEGRIELIQSRRGGWNGTLGGQFYHRNFDAVGAEAYVPRNSTNQYAIFALQEIAMGQMELELAGRYEHTNVTSQPLDYDRSFDTVSGAIGLARETMDGLRFGVNLSRAQRAPSAEELLANGPHLATQQFEIGNPGLTSEKAIGLEAYVRGQLGWFDVNLAVFHSWFADYIHLVSNGEEQDGLPIFSQQQDDARHLGFEAQLGVPLIDQGNFSLRGEVGGEYIRASLHDGTPLERIPPLSLLGALDAKSGPLELRGEVQWFDKQTRIANFETATDGFTHVNLALSWHPIEGQDNLTIMVQADNIFDAQGRRHASFTKDFVPLAGRNLKLSVRASL